MNSTFRNYRSLLEPDALRTVWLAIDYLDGAIAEREVRDKLVRRDWTLNLEFESSNLCAIFAGQLVDLFPRAKFILTIRDPYAWVDSIFNNFLKRPYSPHWAELMRRRMKPDVYPHTKHDAPLAERGLYSLAGYFSYWEEHNRTVLERVPENRLLIVRTNDIAFRTGDMAEFVGVPKDTLVPEPGKPFATRTQEKHGMLARLDPNYVRETAERCCGDLLPRFYPELSVQRPVRPREMAAAGSGGQP